jgi:hypothetical protein
MATGRPPWYMAGPRDAGKKKRGEEGELGRPGLARPRERGRERASKSARGPRARVWLGRAREGEREAARVAEFCFSFSKM